MVEHVVLDVAHAATAGHRALDAGVDGRCMRSAAMPTSCHGPQPIAGVSASRGARGCRR
jgi:hypothetical protein